MKSCSANRIAGIYKLEKYLRSQTTTTMHRGLSTALLHKTVTQALPHSHPRELLLPCQPPAEAAEHEQAAGVGGAGAGAGHRSRARLLPPAGPGQATAGVHDQRRVLAGHPPPLPRGGAGKHTNIEQI